MQNYDEIGWQRALRSRRIVRENIHIPKMQPEIFTRIANKIATVLSADPPIRCLPPKNATPEQSLAAAEIEAGVNDLMDSDDWVLKYYETEFWSSLCPYVAIEVYHATDIENVPLSETDVVMQQRMDVQGKPALDQFGGPQYEAGNRLQFQEQIVRAGGRTRVFKPWECFFDYTSASLEEMPLLFIRYLLSSDEIAERIDSGEWIETPVSDPGKSSRKSRNFGLEIIRSVSGKGTAPSNDYQLERDRSEVLRCYAKVYLKDEKRSAIFEWWVLNREHLLSPPIEKQYKRVKIPYLIYAQKPIPGTQMGIAPAESLKQIQRATNRLFNMGLETINYGLAPVTYMGMGVDFVEENPTYSPGSHIPLTGDANQIITKQIPFDPQKVFGTLEYMDRKGQLVSDVSDAKLGVQKAGTPATATETGLAEQGVATKLGLFITLDTYYFLRKWAEMMYWVTMENNPVLFSINGKDYDLRQWVINGGPRFDLPQVAEVSGRASDKVLLNAAYSQIMPNLPIILSSPIAMKLTEKWLYSQSYQGMLDAFKSDTDEIPPPQIPPEIMALLTQPEKKEPEKIGATNGQNGA